MTARNRLTRAAWPLPLHVAMLFLFSCALFSCDSSTDAPPSNQDDQFVMIHFRGDSTNVRLLSFEQLDIEGEAAVRLSSLIDTNMAPPYRDKKGVAWDTRPLYAYHIIADDGFSASVGRGYPNNVWEHLGIGYIMTASRNILFPKTAIDLPGAYNVKAAAHIHLKRKINILFPDSAIFVEVSAVATVPVIKSDGTQELAISFASMLGSHIPSPEGFNYTIKALDGAGPTPMPWEQFRTGYWLLQSERSLFTDTTLTSGLYRLSAVESIVVTR